MTNQQSQDREAVARRAYELYVNRGYQHGGDQDDWFRAEAELSGGNGSAVSVGTGTLGVSSTQTVSRAAASPAKRTTTRTTRARKKA